MIPVILLVWLVVLMMLSVYHYKRRVRLKQRLLLIGSDTPLRPEHSIVKAHRSGGRVREFVDRAQILLSKKDKVTLGVVALLIMLASGHWLSALMWYWKLGLGVASFWVVFTLLFVLRRQQQTEEFETHIVQVLGLVSRSVSAGLSVPQAIEQVAQSQAGLLAREFSLMRDHLALGIPLRQTLDDACVRLPYRTFRYFSIALILNQSNGGQLRDILNNLSRTMHDNRAMQKKVKSMTSEPRITAKFLFFIPFLLMSAMAWTDMSLLQLLLNSENGQSVLVYCSVSICLGGLILHSLTKNRTFS
ncbi:type II secretion system F family protein [Vibrio ostreicida]|uniref:Type II secretion system F family protein n=1 Tax=Vibrio ostreicida TaxID=526588 RepID=A0ABT8C014_9VIBR|nr:type II secretion system F family protein [Vibrio ostreicida]MDN3612283.1 type II secretion system F family protein [Vibrio ostreicida]NPD08666.1 pilus assembly protein TadB [Vibrio ostreicida]